MSAQSGSVTPMMAQYLGIKEGYPDALLFYRMGDFYELFFDDAVAAAGALDIALTKRGKHLGQDIPMCGVPAHSSEGYLLNLIRKGFRVAVCEQTEDPAEAKKRGSKSVVRREVVRLVTPGTLTEDSLLDARNSNYLTAYSLIRGEGALAWIEISTGEFRVRPCPLVELGPTLARLSPKEIIVGDTNFPQIGTIASDQNIASTQLPDSAFDSASAQKRLRSFFEVKSLDGFGTFARSEVSALGAALEYVELTQIGHRPSIRPPVKDDVGASMAMDRATRRNLELFEPLSGDRRATLRSVIDRTKTASGARLLSARLASPLASKAAILARLDSVEFFFQEDALRERLSAELASAPDLERALSRLSLERGGPRDLAAIGASISTAMRLHEDLAGLKAPELINSALSKMTGFDALATHLKSALVEEPPLMARDGGFVATGYDQDLDEARELRDNGRRLIAEKESEYAKIASVSSLKIKHNNVLGYFIETPATHSEKMLSPEMAETFIHRQTTANAVRFTTVDLSQLETGILNARARTLEIEKSIFDTLRSEIMELVAELQSLAGALAEIDLYVALGDLARTENWVRPEITDNREFEIKGGRHPVVEKALRKEGASGFVKNSSDLTAEKDSARICLLTGPNMAGKSTYLRQNALIAILAQVGSFVPADSAKIGVVSSLFSRVGASDDLARGQSTFMVEMLETAAILNNADDRSLVILDEIGRGTATYDGLSIAWATLEHLHEVNRCRGLFATHYHELTVLPAKHPGLQNATVSVKEWEGEVIFLHEVVSGAADRSYGVQVAKLAGLPKQVISRARNILDLLEQKDREGAAAPEAIIDDLPLFTAPQPEIAPTRESKTERRMEEVEPDTLTPLEALQILYELKELSRS